MSLLRDNSNGLREFGSEMKYPFRPSNFVRFGPDMENQPKDPSQKSRLFGDGSSTELTMQGISFSVPASASPFSFGKPSTQFGRIGNQQSHDNPFQQHSSPLDGKALAWWESPTVGRNADTFGKASTSTGKASPFVFNLKDQEVKNPFQQSKAFGGGGLASKLTHKTIDPSGHASTSSFSFGRPSPSNGIKELENPWKQSTFLVSRGSASKPSQEMRGTGSFLFGKPSTLANSSNVNNPKSLFQYSPPESNRSSWGQQGMGMSTKSGGSPSFRQPACYQNPSLPFTSGSASWSAVPSPPFLPSENFDIKQRTFPREGSPCFQQSSQGGSPVPENIECMEEDILISLSASPSSENISPEELRWKDYQAKQAGASQRSLNAKPSGTFSVPETCNGDAAPSSRQVFTPNPADESAPVFKFWNNGTTLAAPSAGFNSQSFGSIQSTPSMTASPGEAPSPSFSLLPQTTFSGLHNQSQLALQSPFGSAPGLSSGLSSISSVSSPMPLGSCAQAQLEYASSLQWPQSSLQAPILSVPSPSTTITPSLAAASEDQNISMQRDPTIAGGNISYRLAAEMPFKISNIESGCSVRHGISSLPDAGCKYTHPRTVSLLTSKQVFQKTVIRMHSRRHGSLTSEKDPSRVSFLNDYSDVEEYANRDALPVARKNPREFLLGTPWLDGSAL